MSKTHHMYQTTAYKSWADMLQRCKNPNIANYKYYGGRGISVCERWHDFKNFFEDMGECPEGLTLDRIDNEGNYEPGNCKWSTREEQANNTRPRKDFRWFRAINKEMGVEHRDYNQARFAREFGLQVTNVSACLNNRQNHHKGWTFKYLDQI